MANKSKQKSNTSANLFVVLVFFSALLIGVFSVLYYTSPFKLNESFTPSKLKSDSNKSELFNAVLNRDVELIEKLVNDGVDVNKQFSFETEPALREIEATNSSTSLHIASMRGNLEVVTKLLELRADPNVVDGLGMTPLHDAANYRKPKVIEALINGGANVNQRATGDRDQRTPLHFGAENLEITKILLSKGADVNARSASGETALHVAAAGTDNGPNQTPEIMEILLEAGADPNVETKDDGCTPWNYIELQSQTRSSDAKQVLRKYGANTREYCSWYYEE